MVIKERITDAMNATADDMGISYQTVWHYVTRGLNIKGEGDC